MPCVARPWNHGWRRWGCSRSLFRPRVSNDNPYSESLNRTLKYRPDYPSRPFASKDEACEWVAAFGDSVQPPTPPQRHQIHHAPSAPQRYCRRNLPAALRCLQDSPPGKSNTLEQKHSLLASTRRSVDQQAIRGVRTDPGATDNSGRPEWQPRSDTFPESHRHIPMEEVCGLHCTHLSPLQPSNPHRSTARASSGSPRKPSSQRSPLGGTRATPTRQPWPRASRGLPLAWWRWPATDPVLRSVVTSSGGGW